MAERVRIGDELRVVDGGGYKNIDILESDGAQMRLFSFVHETFAGNTYFIYLVIFFFFFGPSSETPKKPGTDLFAFVCGDVLTSLEREGCNVLALSR